MAGHPRPGLVRNNQTNKRREDTYFACWKGDPIPHQGTVEAAASQLFKADRDYIKNYSNSVAQALEVVKALREGKKTPPVPAPRQTEGKHYYEVWKRVQPVVSNAVAELLKLNNRPKRVRPPGNPDTGDLREDIYCQWMKDKGIDVYRVYPDAPGYDISDHTEVKGPGNCVELTPNEYNSSQTDPLWQMAQVDEKTRKVEMSKIGDWECEPSGQMRCRRKSLTNKINYETLVLKARSLC